MILGAGWAFLGLVVVGLAAVALVPSCGIVVVSKAPDGQVLLKAPPLVEADPRLEARAGAVATLSPRRAKRQAKRAMLRIRNTGCDGVRTGSGFALDAKLLIADRAVLPGASALKIASRSGGAKTVEATRVYRLGEFGLARTKGRLPRAATSRGKTVSGAAVAVVGYPLLAKPRLLPGVVVDSVAGAPFGVHGRVIRLTSVLRHDDPGGPVIDAKGRIVAVAFTTDPRSGLAIAAPIATLRSLVAARTLEALPPCAGT